MLLPAVNAQRFSMLPAWPMSFMEDEIQRCDTFKVEPKSIFRDGTCVQIRREMNTEGMGSVIPIKFAERPYFANSGKCGLQANLALRKL